MDLGYSGSKFTWSKHYANGWSICERLDRAFCINDWFHQFAGTKVIHLTCTTSDHIPIWIVPNGLDPLLVVRPFRFKELWLSNKVCGQTVKAVWTCPITSELENQVIKKISKCGSKLTQWSHRNFGNVRREIGEKRKRLARVKKEAMQTGYNFWVREIEMEINDLLIKENKCGDSGQNHSSWLMQTKILNTSTVGQPKGIDKTESWVFRIQWGDGFIIRRILLSPSLSSIKTYFPSQIRPLEKQP